MPPSGKSKRVVHRINNTIAQTRMSCTVCTSVSTITLICALFDNDAAIFNLWGKDQRVTGQQMKPTTACFMK